MDFSFLVVLHGDFPAVGIHPAGDEVVIIRVELTRSPLFVSEAVSKSFVLEDTAAVRNSTAGKTGKTTINVETSRTIEIPSFQIGGTQEAPDTGGSGSFQALRSSDSTHSAILKGGQHPLQNFGGPHDIVVDENGDSSGDFGNGSAHLPALVGLADAQHTDFFVVDMVGEFVEIVDIGVDGDQDQFIWVRSQTGP